MIMYVSIIAPPSIEGDEGKNLTVIDTLGFGLVYTVTVLDSSYYNLTNSMAVHDLIGFC